MDASLSFCDGNRGRAVNYTKVSKVTWIGEHQLVFP